MAWQWMLPEGGVSEVMTGGASLKHLMESVRREAHKQNRTLAEGSSIEQAVSLARELIANMPEGTFKARRERTMTETIRDLNKFLKKALDFNQTSTPKAPRGGRISTRTWVEVHHRKQHFIL